MAEVLSGRPSPLLRGATEHARAAYASHWAWRHRISVAVIVLRQPVARACDLRAADGYAAPVSRLFSLSRVAASGLLGLGACTSAPNDAPPLRALRADPGPTGGTSPRVDPELAFRDLSDWGGVSTLSSSPGLSATDVDGDGVDDLVIPGQDATRVYKGRGDGSFFERTALEHPGVTMIGAYAAEFTGDGFEDLITFTFVDFALWEGTGDGRYTRSQRLPALSRDALNQVLTFGDFAFTGRLDLFLGRLLPVDWSKGPPEPCTPGGADPGSLPGAISHFLASDGRRFTDRAADAGLTAPAKVQAAMAFDLNGDGPLDLLVGTEGHTRDLVYLGDGKGHFVEAGVSLGLTADTSSMGFAVADIDGDGDPELFVSDARPTDGGHLYVRGADGRFYDEAKARGLFELAQYSAWGVGLHDFDNDGDVDLLLVNSVPQNESCIADGQERLYFENDGTGHFTRVGGIAGTGLDSLTEARGAAFSDFDHDGDIDVAVASLDAPPQLLRNELGRGHWLAVRLDYPWYSPAVGAVVTAHMGTRSITRWVAGTASWGGSSSDEIHFGLGDAVRVDALDVRWPHLATDTVGPFAADQRIVVRYTPR
jgi:hypothetical protein